MAVDSINYLEEIDGFLTKFLDNRPGFTNVVISDTSDSANGFARVIPYNLIHIYPYSPEVTSELGNYKSWLYTLLLHEYVHIVHINTKGVIPKFINKIFGKVMAPNQILPRWVTEGIAVYFESLITGYGRVNSSYYKMLFRTYILNHDISLSELTNFSNHYPYGGGTSYLYGSFFIDYIFKYEANFNGLAKFSKNYGANIIPYGINRALKQAKGVTFGQMYKKFKKFYKEKFKKLESKIKKEGITKYKTILKFDKKYILPISHDRKISGQNVSYMTLSDKNELYLVTTGVENNYALYKYSNNKTKKIIDFDDSVSNIEVLDDKLFYVTNTIVDNKYFNRFMVLDLKTKSITKLNNSLRVVNFKLNPYKYEAILVVNEIGIQNLYSFNLQTKKYKKLTNFKEYTTIDIPTFVSENKLILTINKGEEKFWDLYSFNLTNNKLKTITTNNFYEFSPDYINNNRLNIISDREDDILNIYEYNLKTKEFKKKTNFLTGLKQVIYNKKNKVYYALRYQADNGFEAIEIKEKDTINKVSDTKKYIYYDFLANKKDIKYKKIDFSIFPEILPKNFYPQLQSSNFENSISLVIANSDVRDYVGYNLYISYLFDIKDILFSFAYSNFYKSLSYSFAYSFTPLISENLIINGEKTEYNAQYHTFFTNLAFPIFDHYGYNQLYLGISYRYYTFSNLEYEFKPWEKIPILPEESEKIMFSFGYFYSKTSSLLKTPGNSDGTSLNIRFTLREKDLYATYNSLTFAMQFKHYIPLDFLNAAIAIRYNFSVLTSENGLTQQSIGGTPDNGAITNKLIDRTSISGNYLRGYPVGNFKGSLLNLLNIEYRQHLLYPKIGYDTLPFYIHEIYFRTFYDIANITDSFYELDTKSGVGGEIVISFILSYYGLYNMSIGYSKGLDKEGIDHFYLNFISLF